MSKQNFDKFIKKEVKGAKKKEQIKQEKKLVKKEREAYFIEKKREQRAIKKLQEEPAKKDGSNRKRPGNNKAFEFKKDHTLYPKKDQIDQSEKPEVKLKYPSKQAIGHPKKKSGTPEREKGKPEEKKNIPVRTEKPSKQKKIAITKSAHAQEKTTLAKKVFEKTSKSAAGTTSGPAIDKKNEQVVMPLNKYIAHGGICSRRDAGELVKQGKVTVNGIVITEPGTKVNEEDKVTVNGKKVILQHELVYILLNKPKDYITTADDPQGRKTVLDIVKSATSERIFPVGRLDRNTSGVLLLTNDGDLAQQLTHPSYEVRKIYEAKLDKPLSRSDFTKLLTGVTLEDGIVQADSVAYADNKDKSIIGIEIHSGRNRVVRRMFEHLGYDVKGLDRVMFANLTKKNVERGKWRFLNDKEVRLLKYFKSAK